jgi:hypothetical protein
MANAVVASTDDNSGIESSGLSQLEDHQISWHFFTKYRAYDYIAYASPIDDRSALGVSLIRFGVDTSWTRLN